VWGRWEKTGGGGGTVMYLLATATHKLHNALHLAPESAPQASLFSQFFTELIVIYFCIVATFPFCHWTILVSMCWKTSKGF